MRSRKENFWIGAKGGLLDRKHLDAMGEAVWLFLWCLLRQTQVNDAGEGVVMYGNPMSRKAISEDTGGWPEWKIKRWTARLIEKGYIRAARAGNDGLIFFIKKAKTKAKNPKPDTLYFPVQCKQVGTESHRLEGQVGTELSPSRHESAPTYGNNSSKNQRDASFPTTLIPKSLSNYNTEPLARSARSSLSSLAREKQMPRAKSQAELDERRRELRLQGEEVKRKYPAKGGSPGKALEMQPQEAIARCN